MQVECRECGAIGYSLVCTPCRKFLKTSNKAKYTKEWHDIIVGDNRKCFHCEKEFDRELLCGDHFWATKGARPDLRYDTRVGVPCCAQCNTSGSPNRKDPKQYLEEHGYF